MSADKVSLHSPSFDLELTTLTEGECKSDQHKNYTVATMLFSSNSYDTIKWEARFARNSTINSLADGSAYSLDWAEWRFQGMDLLVGDDEDFEAVAMNRSDSNAGNGSNAVKVYFERVHDTYYMVAENLRIVPFDEPGHTPTAKGKCKGAA